MYATVKDLWAYAVEGCPITLTYNIRPQRGLSNGTRAFIHSIVLNDNEPLETIHKCRTARPGEVVTLQHPPLVVNVTVAGAHFNIDALNNAHAGEMFVPLFPIARDVNIAWYIPMACRKKGTVTIMAHPYQLLFATTFHGVQCRTLDKIILCVDHPIMPPLSYNS